MRSTWLVLILVILTALFCWGLGWIAWGFAQAGGVIGWGLALAVVILLVLTIWVTWREVLFGMAAARLGRSAAERAAEPGQGGVDAGAVTPRERFEAARAAVSAHEGDWRAWYRLALAYEGMRDRRHARECVRRAIALESAARRAGSR